VNDPVVLLDEQRDPAPEPSPRRPRRLRRLVVATIAVVVVALLGAVLVPSRHGARATALRLPVLGPARDVYDGDLGDPFVLPIRSDGKVARFVVFGTGDWPSRVPTASSADLTTWQAGPDALPKLPPWTSPDPRNSLSWAPAALQTDAGYLLYITLPEARSGQQCIAVARSPAPEGPYVGVGDGPLLCQHDLGGSIDPAVSRDGAGRLHILWKNDGNSVGAPSSLWEQQLTPDGLRVTGTAHRLLSADQPWHGGIVEEPAVLPASGGGWWLFYSANSFDKPEYATGLAYCPSLSGPCRATSQGPFLDTAALKQERQFAPGGLETFTDAHGALWAVFDTWNRPPRNGRFRCCRSLQMAPVLSS